MSASLEPSQVLRAAMHRYRNELAKLEKQPPLWRCFDCHRWIPRSEFPMRCQRCSGPDLKGKKIGYRHLKVRQDAMICINCADAHTHLREKIFELQMQVYEVGVTRHALGVN